MIPSINMARDTEPETLFFEDDGQTPNSRHPVLFLPAGTGHCRLSASADFALTAAYPADQGAWDLCRPDDETDLERDRDRIASVPIPPADPVTGVDGALTKHWNV